MVNRKFSPLLEFYSWGVDHGFNFQLKDNDGRKLAKGKNQ